MTFPTGIVTEAAGLVLASSQASIIRRPAVLGTLRAARLERPSDHVLRRESLVTHAGIAGHRPDIAGHRAGIAGGSGPLPLIRRHHYRRGSGIGAAHHRHSAKTAGVGGVSSRGERGTGTNFAEPARRGPRRQDARPV